MEQQAVAQAEAGAVALEDDSVDAGESAFDRLRSLDQELLLALRPFRRPWRTALAQALTRLGDGRTFTTVGLALLATRTTLGTHLGLRLAAATLLTTLAAQALKRSLTRPRPDAAILEFEALAENPDRFSFPSGHTAAAFSVAIAFLGEPFGIGFGTLLLASGIGFSRTYLGAHYPSEVGAGALLGALGGLAARLCVG